MESLTLSKETTLHPPMIAVCCICNKQRTGVYTWEPLDVSGDSEEIFTHGFCPDCIRQHYPKISNKIDKAYS